MEDLDQFDEEEIAKLEELQKLLKLDGSSKLPSTKGLLEMLESSELSEEMKENMRQMLTGNVPQVFHGYPALMAILFAVLIFSIILFFGYKLYKSIKEKELKREEKKKAKQMKKKK